MKCERCTILFNGAIMREKPHERNGKYYCSTCIDKPEYVKQRVPYKVRRKQRKRKCALCDLRFGTMNSYILTGLDMEVCLKCYNNNK